MTLHAHRTELSAADRKAKADDLVCVWDGTRGKSPYGAYLNCENVPTRPAPPLHQGTTSVEWGCNAHLLDQARPAPARASTPRRPYAEREPLPVEGVTRLLRLRPYTIAELMCELGKTQWQIRAAMRRIGPWQIDTRLCTSLNGVRPPSQFWMKRGV